MECIACTRSDSTRHYYCTPCLKTRLSDHQARKQQLRNALTLQSNRASSLLANGPPSTTSQGIARSRPFGIREESLLKAERWTLSVRLRDTRIATEDEKSKVETLTKRVASRRAALDARKANLTTARSLLSSLSTPSYPTSPALPLALSSYTSRLLHLTSSLTALSESLTRVRRILTRELLTTYSFKVIESPLPDPFLIHPSSSPPPQSTHFPPSYTLATLPLPTLSLLTTLSPETLEAILVHLSHLTRLLALYEGIPLPFVPLPNCYGPGRAGIRPSPAFSDSSGIDSVDEETAANTCWPLSLTLEKTKIASARNGSGETETNEEERQPHTVRPGSTSRSGLGSRKGATTMLPRDSGRDSKVSSKRFKLVMKGAIALAFDLGYICWARESRNLEGESGEDIVLDDWKVEDLEDLGKLLMRAAGSETEKEKEERRQGDRATRGKATPTPHTLEDLDPFPSLGQTGSSVSSVATLQSPPSQQDPARPPAFPLSFALVSQHFLALAFDSATDGTSKKRRKNVGSAIGRGTRMGESSFVDAGSSTARLGEDEEGEEEEEWDLV